MISLLNKTLLTGLF